MSKVVLLDYENNHDYDLIGIHTPLEDFRLAFFINNSLNICLSRHFEDLDFSTDSQAFYALYTFNCKQSFVHWSLIANKHSYLTEDNSQLFHQQEKTTILIKEKRQVDYFLKIEGEITKKRVDEVVQDMNKINNVITSYTINPQTLKSKDFLIF